MFLLFQVSKGFFMSKPNMKTKASVFSMGQRSEVLSTDLEAPILVPHALEKTSTRVCITTYKEETLNNS